MRGHSSVLAVIAEGSGSHAVAEGDELSLIIKQVGTGILLLINLVLLGWGVAAYRRRESLTNGFYRWLPVSYAVAASQVLLGVFFVVTRGWPGDGMHMLYGALVALGALAQALLGAGTRLGQRYRGKPLVYAFISLFVALVAVRSYMSA